VSGKLPGHPVARRFTFGWGAEERKRPATVYHRAGQAVQLRLATGLTSREYSEQELWRSASLSQCPLHCLGGCGFSRHSAYQRVNPPIRVARFYCPKGHQTFSLLPDFAASRLSSSLQEIEEAVAQLEEGPTMEQAASRVRPEIELQGAVRWLRRRASAVAALLVTLIGLLPHQFAKCTPTVESFRSALQTHSVLPLLREVAAEYLPQLPPHLGFGPRSLSRKQRRAALQHKPGADP
jgi:hypothetical protein